MRVAVLGVALRGTVLLHHLVVVVATEVGGRGRNGMECCAKRECRAVECGRLDGATGSREECGVRGGWRGCRIGRGLAGSMTRSQICQLRRPSSVNKVAERLLLVLVSTTVFVWANGRACSGS